ncbi:sodium:calcium antiporter [Patescibacteria group bacterium]|nr:sodium:calcium antiporter [Patescibacteria group bacterium]
MPWIYILIFIGSCLVLVRSGTWVVRSLVRIARALEWSGFLVAFILMAFATSLPELFVGLSSAFYKIPQLSFGNVIGANILNLTLGVAVAVLLAQGLILKRQVAKKDSFYTALIAFLPILLMLDGQVSRVDGIVLLGALGFYLKQLLPRKQKFTKVFTDKFTRDWPQFKLFLKEIAIFFVGIGLLLLSAEGVVRSASFFARAINLPLVATGILFVSLGTILPELTFGVKAITMGHKEMVLGNFMGTVVCNSTLILGVVSLISPLKIANFSPYFVGILFTVIVALTFVIFARTERKITRKEALFLLGIYALFIAFQLLIK